LRVEQHGLVADDVGVIRVLRPKREVEVLFLTAQRGEVAWRIAARIEPVAAGKVERQAQAEAGAFLHLGDALQQLLAGNEIDATELIVGAEIAPVGSFRSPLPTLLHRLPSSYIGAE
jgi:hypothetical protein